MAVATAAPMAAWVGSTTGAPARVFTAGRAIRGEALPKASRLCLTGLGKLFRDARDIGATHGRAGRISRV